MRTDESGVARESFVLWVKCLAIALTLGWAAGCREPEPKLVDKSQTFAELRAIKRGVRVQEPGAALRAPYPRERLVDGERVELSPGALAWLRRDGGAQLLVAGPASLSFEASSVRLDRGKVFVDVPVGLATDVATPGGVLHLAAIRASLEVDEAGALSAYVLRGALQLAGVQAAAGERLLVPVQGKPSKAAAIVWDDWTGGLATLDRAPEPAPFGVGTVGARQAGNRGQPRFPLAIERMDVRVRVVDEFALTEVEQVFANPTSDTVEGLYSFRTPLGASLERFGVDRDGQIVWGRVQEKQVAQKQYESHVYAGSSEDPALLAWEAPGVYSARFYPMEAGARRRVVVRYSEWLGRHGADGERRLYVYPMAAEGAEASLPRIEELTLTLDLAEAKASQVRVGMEGKQVGKTVTVKAFDFVPHADFSVELFDAGTERLTAYRAPHSVDEDVVAADRLSEAKRAARGEAGYVLVPVRPTRATEPEGGLDLAVLVDASAATDPGALAVARALCAALLTHLGPEDRAAVWAADASLRPVAAGSDVLAPLDAERREAILNGLAQVDRGGATDLGAVVADVASRLDPNRRSAVVYVGDGRPTVGERLVPELDERLRRLPRPVRLFALGVGHAADMALLDAIARGGFAERVGDGYAAGQAALRVLEQAEEPVWLGAEVEFGPGVDRVFPRELGVLSANRARWVVGRVVGKPPSQLTLRGVGGEVTRALSFRHLNDAGDLRRRWAEARLAQLLDDGAGPAAVVELGVGAGIVTPYTSYYVPTAEERNRELGLARKQARAGSRSTWWDWLFPADATGGSVLSAHHAEVEEVAAISQAMEADDREGGTGTRAKGEEAKLGRRAPASNKRYAVAGPPDDSPVDKNVLSGAGGLGLSGAKPAPSRLAAAARKARPKAAPPPPVQESMLQALPGSHSLEAVQAVGRAPGVAGQLGGRAGLRVAEGGGVAPGLTSVEKDAPVEVATLDESKPDELAELELAIGTRGRRETEPPLDGAIGHDAVPCSEASRLPLAERRRLWEERFSASPTAESVEMLYYAALRGCEAGTWRERTTLIFIAVRVLPSVRQRVQLWHRFRQNRALADVIYRAILTRVQTAEQLRELHAALGLPQMDRDLLARALERADTPHARVRLLRELVRDWPDDWELALELLYALEDVGDDGGGRALARQLRQRADATPRLRTEVGEYYLRLSERTDATKERDLAEARRTFGEIVEFAPDDPHARRLLGDLLRAHGWYEEALRQYETLAQLAPDDTSVGLSIAAAAEGLGRTEEAVKWTEKSAANGSPDPSAPQARSSRAFASAFLAWARIEARQGGRNEEVARLRQRALRLTASDLPESGGVRWLLSWAHPELRPELWHRELGAWMPAGDGDPYLGLLQVVLPKSDREGVQIRLAPQDADRAARLGVTATLTAIVDEGQDSERIERRTLRFASAQPKAPERRGFRLTPVGLEEEVLP